MKSTLERELNVPANVADQSSGTLKQLGLRFPNVGVTPFVATQSVAPGLRFTNRMSSADMSRRRLHIPVTFSPSGDSVPACDVDNSDEWSRGRTSL